MIEYYLNAQPESIEDWFNMLDAAFDSGICQCVTQYEKDVFQVQVCNISRVINVKSDVDYQISVYNMVGSTSVTFTISNNRIDPQQTITPIRQFYVEQANFKNLFLFCCADAFCFPGLMCLLSTQFTGDVQQSLVFTHNERDVFTSDFSRYCLIIDQSLQMYTFFRITDVVYTANLGAYLPTSQIISGTGFYAQNQLGFYNSVYNQKPGFLYILRDLKTGGKSKAVLLYGCFKLLETQED